MPLNGSVLGQQLKTVTDAFNDQPAPADEAEMEAQRVAYWNAVGVKMVEYFTANAQVSTTVSTTGSASAQTGTGTGGIS